MCLFRVTETLEITAQILKDDSKSLNSSSILGKYSVYSEVTLIN